MDTRWINPKFFEAQIQITIYPKQIFGVWIQMLSFLNMIRIFLSYDITQWYMKVQRVKIKVFKKLSFDDVST